MILTPLQKLPNNAGDLGKIIVATCFEWLPKVQKSPNQVTLVPNILLLYLFSTYVGITEICEMFWEQNDGNTQVWFCNRDQRIKSSAISMPNATYTKRLLSTKYQ